MNSLFPLENMTDVSFSAPQAEIVEQGLLTTGFNCILQMPTGSGKTWLAEQAMEHALAKGQLVVYLTPLRALASELLERWRTRFSSYRVGVFTGDFGISGQPYPVPFGQAQLLIMTPERLDACTRAWRAHWHWIPEVDLVVVDEFHLLGEPQRGARLEGTLLRFMRLNPFARFLGLSATLGNRTELADWLQAVEYESTWRPVSLTWRIVSFRRASDKPQLVAEEVERTRQEGGQTLIFVQSRRRAEELSRYLIGQGIQAHHHHAGLSHTDRQAVEAQFRAHTIHALVATATLEMGINLPVCQVILYDLQGFNGQDFRPLSVNTVWQRVGRAGRRGLDASGEAVLLAPAWDAGAKTYTRGKFDAILSGLNNPSALAEQIVAEVASGLSRTARQLQVTFAGSLANHQNRLPSVDKIISEMQEAGMIRQRLILDESADPVLVATRLGRVATRHFLSPSTVLQLRNALHSDRDLTFFDLLLLAASKGDCEPVLPVDYEELDSLADALSAYPSCLLGLPKAELFALVKVDGRRLLSALKMAVVMRIWTHLGDAQTVADLNDCYPFEVGRLKESMLRLLIAMSTIAAPEEGVQEDEPDAVVEADYVPIQERVIALRSMIDAGLDESSITLTFVNGLGSSYARKLHTAGIRDIEELAQAEPEMLTTLGGIGHKRAERWIEAATSLIPERSATRYQEFGVESGLVAVGGWPSQVDPYRLRRAVDLQVTRGEDGSYFVTGGLEPHRVLEDSEGWRCDCADAARGHLCKHVLAVRLTQGDETVHQAVTRLLDQKEDVRLNLFNLWTTR